MAGLDQSRRAGTRRASLRRYLYYNSLNLRRAQSCAVTRVDRRATEIISHGWSGNPTDKDARRRSRHDLSHPWAGHPWVSSSSNVELFLSPIFLSKSIGHGTSGTRGRLHFRQVPVEHFNGPVRFSWAGCLILDIPTFEIVSSSKELRRILAIERLSVRILHGSDIPRSGDGSACRPKS